MIPNRRFRRSPTRQGNAQIRFRGNGLKKITKNEEVKESIHERIQQNLPKSKGGPVDKLSLELHNSFQTGTRSTGAPEYKYPDYYGGSYIDNEGNLTIIIVENQESKLKEELQRRLSSNHFIVKKGEYSYNYLESVQEKFKEYITTNPSKLVSENFVSAYYIDVYSNRHVIEIIDFQNKEIINEIKKILAIFPA